MAARDGGAPSRRRLPRPGAARRSVARRSAALAALLLTVSACTSGPAVEPAPDPEVTPAPEVTPTTPEPEPTTAELGPLDRYLEQIADAWDEDFARAQMIRAEQVIAQCMLEQGFTYTPVDHSGSHDPAEPLIEPDAEWGTPEFAERYGYGATTDPWASWGAPPEEPTDEWVDPNQAYVDGLPPAEQEAYWVALYGEEHGVPEPAAELEYGWEEAGCNGRAQHEVYESPESIAQDQFSTLQEDMATVRASVPEDARVLEAAEAWARCMADAGHPGLSAVADAEQAVYDAVNAVYDRAYSDVDRGAPMSEEDWLALEAETRPALDELTPWEIEMAVADLRCRDEVRYEEIEHAVDVEYQEAFVELRREELDAWLEATRRAASGQAGD